MQKTIVTEEQKKQWHIACERLKNSMNFKDKLRDLRIQMLADFLATLQLPQRKIS